MKSRGVIGGEIRAYPINDGVCPIEECGRKSKVRGMCAKHYQRWLRYGDPLYERALRPHGHVTRYVAGCRCEPCKKANTERLRALRFLMKARLLADPSLAPHGTASTYSNWGCRCDECKAAHSEKMRSPEHRAAVARYLAKRRVS